jgi:hypothetical protein
MGISALAKSGTSSAPVDGIASKATLTGNIKDLDVTLTSARGSGTYGLGDEKMAELALTVTGDLSVSSNASTGLQALSSIKVGGSGKVTINAGSGDQTTVAKTTALKTIDLSGMAAFANQDSLGQQVLVNGTTLGYLNLSTSSVTLNNNVAETVTLGGADDTVITGSTIGKMDSIRGFSLVATIADPKAVDTAKSDYLNIGSAFTGYKMTTSASSLNAALLEAANLSVGGSAKQNVVFAVGGNTYVYVDVGTEGLTDDDILVELVGTFDLDLLIAGNAIGG